MRLRLQAGGTVSPVPAVSRARPLAALAALAFVAAGCGENEVDKRSELPAEGPAVTTPNTGVPYEDGGGDGSGADGVEARDRRGGVAASPDSRNPDERPGGDPGFNPPRE
jgi:hypothetical protein